MISQQELRERLGYDSETGVFIWLTKVAKRVSIGDVAGSRDTDGYIRIKINGKKYSAHRLAWFHVHGYFPEHEIDHMNGVRDDNRLNNLREVTRVCNMQNKKKYTNNASGFNGVNWDKGANRWRAKIMIRGKRLHLGYHDDRISAALARVAFEESCDKWTCDHRVVNRVKLRKLGYNV